MIEDITSLQNKVVKAAAELKQKKNRSKQGEFLVEGFKGIEEMLQAQVVPTKVFFAREYDEQAVEFLDKYNYRGRAYRVTEEILAKIADAATPQGIVACCPCWKTGAFTWEQGMVVALDGVSDPGNVGTILRSADAAGCSGVVLLEDCADIFSPKVVRSTMGSLFHLPVYTCTKEELVAFAKSEGAELWSAALDGAVSLYDISWPSKAVVVMGNEAHGVSAELQEASDKKMYIPMTGKAESLNVAMATTVVLFEGQRMRGK